MGLFGSSVQVASHRMGWGKRDVLELVRLQAPVAVKVVEQHFGRRLEPVRITLTTPDGVAELACRAEFQFAPELPERERADGLRLSRRNARGVAGHVVLNPRGRRGTLMFLNVRAPAMKSREGIATVLGHELVHCDQLGRPGVRELLIAHARHEFEVEPLAPDLVTSCAQMIDGHEVEAYGLEDAFARQLVRGLSTSA